YRDQSLLPNYDSAANDFNFATVYTENAFSGNDRISDSNTLTVGVTSRLIDPDSGAEAARFGIAQRLRFKDQRVTLPGGTAVSARYNPGPYRNISAAYRYQANTTSTSNDGNKSLDVSWQWPLNDLWG